MENKTLTYPGFGLLCCFCSCTSTGLYPEGEYPHITDIRVRLSWRNTDKNEIPAEVHIIASYIINTRRTRGVMDTSTDPATASNITQQGNSSNNPQTEEGDGSSFYLCGGEYNISVTNDQCTDVATPADGTEPPPLPIVSISNLDSYTHDNRVSVKDLYLQISNMDGKKPDIVAGNDLPNLNLDEEYLQELKSLIYYVVQKDTGIRTDGPTLIGFGMQRISQRIDIILNIRTKGDIKKGDLLPPIIELSDVRGHFNIFEACLDTTRLYQTVHQAQSDELMQTGENTCRCAVYFHTLGIIPSAAKRRLDRPDILQVVLQVLANRLDASGAPVLDQDDKPVRNNRYICGAINPYNELTAAQPIEVCDGKTYLRYSKDDVNIKVTSSSVIKADQVISDDTGMGWQLDDPINPDNDTIIEI